jgi:hypothetical protein
LEINISYVVEPECLYETNVTQLLSDKNVMLHEGSEIEEFYEVGCKVKVRWSKRELETGVEIRMVCWGGTTI